MANTTVAEGSIQATNLSGTAATDLSMFGLFLQADWVVKAVMLMLILASFWCWAIIFEKWMVMRSVRSRGKSFEKEFWAAEALDKFHEKMKKKGNHPMAIVFLAGMDEWFRSRTAAVRSGVRTRVSQMMQVARNREVEKLENGLGFLATISTAAPFIGLFGTVWGIMNSFHAIALSKNTSLAAVAPGIAEALFATAIGLFAAIPALIAYNHFTQQISLYSGKVDDFMTEFDTILARQIEN